MNQKDYKKTYEGDYTKSYRDQATWARESAQRRQAYDVVSKKLDARPYNKKERSAVYDITGTRPKESERVYAEGSHHEKRTPRPQTPIRDRKLESKPQQRQQEQVQPQPRPTPTPQVEPKRPSPATNTQERRESTSYTEVEDDGNYNHLNPPIRQIGLNKYLNLKTQEELNTSGARRILERAGYQPKGMQNIGSLVFIFVIMNIVLPFIIPAAIAILYGAFRLLNSNTTWIKNYGQQVYRFILPSSPEEMDNNRRIAWIAIGVGIITLIIRSGHLIFS